LGTVLFNSLITDLGAAAERTLSEVAGDIKLGGAADMPEGRAAIQRDLEGLEEWTDGNLMKFSQRNCRVLPLERNSCRYWDILGVTKLESSLAEKDLGVLVDVKLNMSSHHSVLAAKKAEGIWGCVRQGIGSRLREMILPLCLALERARLECWVQCWASQHERDVDILERVQGRVTKDLEHLSYEERLREQGLFSLDRRRLGGNLTKVYKYLQGGCKEDRARLCPVVPSDGPRGSGQELKNGRVPLNIRKCFFAVRVTAHWHRVPRESVASPSLEILRICLDMVLGNQLWVALPGQGGWTR